MLCIQCGTGIPEHSQFCLACGRRLPEPAEIGTGVSGRVTPVMIVAAKGLIAEYKFLTLVFGTLGIIFSIAGATGIKRLDFLGYLTNVLALTAYAKAKGRSAGFGLWGFAWILGWIALVVLKTHPRLSCSGCGHALNAEIGYCPGCGGRLPETVHVAPKSPPGGFVVSRADLESRYRALSDEELLGLRRSELTGEANECVDREMERRGRSQPPVEATETGTGPPVAVTALVSKGVIAEYNHLSLLFGIPGIMLVVIGSVSASRLLWCPGIVMYFVALAYYAKAKGRSAAYCFWGFLSLFGWIALVLLKTHPRFTCSGCGHRIAPATRFCQGCGGKIAPPVA